MNTTDLEIAKINERLEDFYVQFIANGLDIDNVTEEHRVEATKQAAQLGYTIPLLGAKQLWENAFMKVAWP